MSNYDLMIAKSVAAGMEDCKTVIPEEGTTVIVKNFTGAGAAQPDSAIKLIWDHGGAGETLLWSIKGDGQSPTEHIIKKTETDGLKKLALCIENASDFGLYLSAFANVAEVKNG